MACSRSHRREEATVQSYLTPTLPLAVRLHPISVANVSAPSLHTVYLYFYFPSSFTPKQQAIWLAAMFKSLTSLSM